MVVWVCVCMPWLCEYVCACHGCVDVCTCHGCVGVCTCHGCMGVCVHAMVVWVSEELSPYTVGSGDQIRLSGMASCAHTYLQVNAHT